MKKYLKLMRVHHYLKNLLVFAPLMCSGQFFNEKKLTAALLGFLSFCLISSVVYIINDIRDREKDRLHPTKRNRPIASGAVSVKTAWVLAACLLALALICNFAVFHPAATALLILYLALNLAYSFGLKNVPIIDISILVSGFLIRVAYGSMVAGIEVSSWLYLTVIALSFYFALGKRRNELRQSGGDATRKVLRAYPMGFLDKNMYLCLALANVFYALWSTDAKTVALYHTDALIFTVPIVLLITMKYNLNIEGDSDGDPVEVLLHDKILIGMCAAYFAVMFSILYLFR